MDKLIASISQNVGIDETLARKAVSVILTFINRDGPKETEQVIRAMPGAEQMINKEGGGGGLMGGLMGSMGAMGALSQLTSLGLDMGQVSGVTREVIAYAKEFAGEDAVDEIVASIPGLSQVI